MTDYSFLKQEYFQLFEFHKMICTEVPLSTKIRHKTSETVYKSETNDCNKSRSRICKA